MLDHEKPGRKVLNCIKVNVQNRHMIARVSTTAARKPSLSHNASVTSNIYFFLSSFLLCNFLSGSVTVERWINEQGLIWNTWEKLQLKTKCVFISLISACCSYGSVSSSRTIKNSRLVSQKDDVHVCIMCLRAIMNYQVLVMAVEDWRRARTLHWDVCVCICMR